MIKYFIKFVNIRNINVMTDNSSFYVIYLYYCVKSSARSN